MCVLSVAVALHGLAIAELALPLAVREEVVAVAHFSTHPVPIRHAVLSSLSAPRDTAFTPSFVDTLHFQRSALEAFEELFARHARLQSKLAS